MNRRELTDSPFRDVSNLHTPKPNPKSPSPVFFTASKAPLPAPTPTPLGRRRPLAGAATPARRKPLATPTPLGRRLRALELDQSRSARRAESGRERALRAFAASASSWLSLLLRDPSACGCSPAASATSTTHASVAGKRGALDGERARGSSPKRHRGRDRCGERRKAITPAMVAVLRDSLREVCSLEDLKERMGKFMSTEACQEVLLMMCQICKNIDERRLKMKAHCPIVTDLRLKENATRVFMCYNPEWLRIGLHIILGGDDLLQSGSRKREKEVSFLKLLLEKQLFCQNVSPKTFARNKVVEGLHRTGYTEASANIVLKRMFLLVAVLDMAKMESALPLKSGIDSLDGGSPPLFCQQAHIKSSWQIIQESLAEAMHGEGDLLMHLSTMGYKLNYKQLALSEYDFTIGNLFEDLQDGIILCRVLQLLLSDASIILKVIAPSDTHKKKLHNCTMAIQYIKQAGVPLSDADGVLISAEDIANGDKELIISLLWNIFTHMQLPLLVNKTSLARELSRFKAPAVEQSISETKSHMGLLYDWIQVVCAKYGISVESPSQIDRRALNYLIKHYLNISINGCPLKETFSDCRKELFSCHEQYTSTDTISCPPSKIGEVLGDFLQGFPASDILANDVLFDEKGAVVLIAFLCSHLTNDKRLEQLRNLVNTRLDYQSLQNKAYVTVVSPGKNDVKYQSPHTNNTDDSCSNQERSATTIQTQIRQMIARNKYHKLRRSAIVIQQAVRIWIRERKRSENIELFETAALPKNDCIEMFHAENETVACKDVGTSIASAAPQCLDNTDSIDSVTILQLGDQHRNNVTSAIQLCNSGHDSVASPTPHQAMVKSGSIKSGTKHLSEVETANPASATKLLYEDDMDYGSNISYGASFQHEQPLSAQLDFLLCKDVVAARKIQFAYRRFLQVRSSRMSAATKIQSHWRGFTMRMCFTKQVEAIIAIQSVTRQNLCSWAFHQHRNNVTSAIQLCNSGHDSVASPTPHQAMVKSGSIKSGTKHLSEVETANPASATKLVYEDDMDYGSNISYGASFQHEQPLSAQLDFLLCKDVVAARKIQFAYRRFLQVRSSRMSAATKIQSHWRGFTMRMCFTKQVEAIIAIQSVTRQNLCSWAFHQHRNNVTSAIQLCNSGHDSVASPTPHQAMVKSGSIKSGTKHLSEVETANPASATKLVYEDDMDYGSNISYGASFQHEQPLSAQLDFLLCKDVVAARKIQFAYRRFLQVRSSRMSAATKIQSHWRGFTMRMCFTKQVEAIIAIQSVTRQNLCSWAFQCYHDAAIKIQRIARGHFARKRLLGSVPRVCTGLFILDRSQQKRSHQSIELKIVVYSALRLQRWWRKVLLHRSIRISAIAIQSLMRGWLAQKQVKQITCSIYVIQRWWRKVLFLESRKRAATAIQSHVRGWIARQAAIRKKKCITIIQVVNNIQSNDSSFVKAYHVRKASKQEVADVRSRIQKASAQVGDDMRLINRLIAALSHIIGCRSISSIRQTCTRLSTATELSGKCCETLVDAGAVDILLKQIPQLNRGIPDQEVLKQVLYTLRNIARFPNLRPVLANTPQLVNTIFQELLRNKSEVFFIACGILKKLCETKEGREIAGGLRHHIRRLGSIVQDLEKRVELDKRHGCTGARKEDNLRRLGEAATLFHLLTNDL